MSIEEHNLTLCLDEYLPLRDVVFNTLRQGILTGELKPGERLMEIHLADKLGVSRTPIREAIRMLELEGLVTMIPRKGAEVSTISAKDLRDVLEVRRSLDTLAVVLACRRITEEKLKELKEAARSFENALVTKNATEIAKADVRFHDVILEASDNNRLSQMVNKLADRVYRYRLEYVKDTNNHKRLLEEHNVILQAIEEGDADKAKKAIEIHIDNQEKGITSQLRTGKEE